MYLKKLEIYGFKSFAEKVDLEFDEGLTAVVGPNGSGKSNITDAVRWVLGEQSAKTLRGSKMEDIIFSGTQKRKSLSYAEVSLIIDNYLGELPIDYSEVRITRRVFRSGESEYYINKSSCRLKDIQQLFMDTGLGKEGYSIIGQGRIDEILSSNVQDRRSIFEEAAGIVKYKVRKNEATKKLDRAEKNLIRIMDIIKELEQQIEPLSLQADKAKRYIRQRDNLKELELAIFIYKMDDLHQKQQKYIINHTKLLTQAKEKEIEIEEKEREYQELKKNSKGMDERLIDCQNNLYEIKSKIERTNSEEKIMEGKLENISENKVRLLDEIAQTRKRLDLVIQKKNDIKKKDKNFAINIEKISKDLLESKKKYELLKSILGEKELNSERKTQEKFKLINTLSEYKSNLNGLHIMNANIEEQLVQLDTENIELEKNIDRNKKNLKNINLNIDDVEKDISTKLESKNRLDKELREKMNLIKECNERKQEIFNKRQEIESRINVLTDMEKDYEGYFKSVKNLMQLRQKDQSLKKEIYGVVAELIDVPKEYVDAIEVALGSSLQNIVISDEYVAKKCIEILNYKKWGRATFLPLKTIKGKKIGKEIDLLNNKSGFIGIASDLINYDPVFSNVLNQLLGRVIVVDGLDDAINFSRKLNNRYKIVTLKGEVFNPGGSIVGGSRSKNNTGLLTRGVEIENLKKKSKERLTKYNLLKEDIKVIESKNENIMTQIDDLVEELKSKEIHLISLKNDYKQIETEQIRYKNELIKSKEEINKLGNKKNDIKLNVSKLNNSISKFNLSIGNIDIQLSDIHNISQEEKNKLEVLSSEITQLEIEIAKIQQQKAEGYSQLTQINLDINNYKQDLEKNLVEIKEFELMEKKNNHKILEFKEEAKTLNKRKINEEAEIKKLTVKKEAKDNELEKHNEKLKINHNELMSINNSIHKIDIQLNKIEMEIENIENKIYEDYQLTYNLSLGYKKDLMDLSKTYFEIKNLKDEIKSLGHINLDSIDEFEKVSERFNFLTEQRDDLIHAKESLNQVIHEITENMEKQFKSQFNIIREKFNEVFKDLFKGGYGELILTDSSNPLSSGVEIEVQPPGKKLQNLSLLSGGEKALTAIALLFAILKVKPTPFCLLDEIEAALDDANVTRFANFLKTFSKNTQFIAVTHRKGTMESANALYGVTMEEQGVSKLVSVKLSHLVG